jgi:hypothetical protein
LKEANMLGPYPADLNKTLGQTFRQRPNHQHQSREAGSFSGQFLPNPDISDTVIVQSGGVLSAPSRSSHHIKGWSLHLIQSRLSGAVRYLCLGTGIAKIYSGLLKRRIFAALTFAGDREPICGDATVHR